MRIIVALLAALLVPVLAAPAVAQGPCEGADCLEITLLATGLDQPKGIDKAMTFQGPGGLGDYLYVAESGKNQMVFVDKGGLGAVDFCPTKGQFPVGVACTGMPFAQYIYVGNAMEKGIWKADVDGRIRSFALENKGIADMAFGGIPYGHELYAGEWAMGNIWKVDCFGQAELFASLPGTETRYLEFAPNGAGFSEELYFTDYVNGDIYRVDPTGTPHFLVATGSPCLEGLAFSKEPPFGKALWAGDICTGEIFRYDRWGHLRTFDFGFEGVADIIFDYDLDGRYTMYLVDGHDSVFAVNIN